MGAFHGHLVFGALALCGVRMKQHEYDDDGCCIHCGFDGAEWHWWKTSTYEGRALAGEECEPGDRIKEPECVERK